MATETSFFNDVLYDASDVNKHFADHFSDGIISDDGTIGDRMKVTAKAGFNIHIADGTYIIGGAKIAITGGGMDMELDGADLEAPRIDIIAVERNYTPEVHDMRIVQIKGPATPDPQMPELTQSSAVYQCPLAYIYVPAGALEVGTITDMRSDICTAYAMGNKLDKSGGDITGDLGVTGDLDVSGNLTHNGNAVIDRGITNKLLWSGNWSSGEITVPGLNDYTVFRVDYTTTGTGVLAVREGIYFRGGNFFSTADGSTYLVDISATINGEKLTYINSHSRSITPAGVVGAGTDQTEVTAIYGII